MVGRPRHNYWDALHFEMGPPKNGKRSAICLLCNRDLKNTSRTRLVSHRRNCPQSNLLLIDDKTNTKTKSEKHDTSSKSYIFAADQNSNHSMDTEESKSNQMCIEQKTEEYIIQDDETTEDDNQIGLTMIIEHSSDIKQELSRSQTILEKSQSESARPATFSKETSLDLEDAHLAFSEFFISSNIPFKALKSKYLTNFLAKLNTSYKPPNLNELTTIYVDRINEKYKVRLPGEGQNAILILTGWKDLTLTSRCVVACLHSKSPNESQPVRVFLNAWNIDRHGVATDEEMQVRIIQEARELASCLYDIEVYAIISDNLMLQVQSFEFQMWHIVCHSNLAGCLAEMIVSQSDVNIVKQILEQFQPKNMEAMILKHGGTRIMLPSEKRWCTYRDSFKCFIDNYPVIKELVGSDQCSIHPITEKFFDNDEFVTKIRQYHKVLQPICNLIYSSQKKTTTLADIVEEWLQLSFSSEYQHHLNAKRKEALTPFAIAANYFHPVYLGKQLTEKHKIILEYFLVESLDSEGLDQLVMFKRREGIFKMLADKKLSSYDTFWTMAEQFCPELATLAKKLLCIPVSTSYIDKILTNWSVTHSTTKHLLGIELYKKLMRTYFNLNFCESV